MPKIWELKPFARLILVLIGYIVAARLGLALAIVQANSTTIWAPTGIAIAVILVWGYDLWLAVFAGAFIVNFITPGTPLVAVFTIAVGNTLEAVAAAYLVKRFANGRHAFDHPTDVFAFALFAGVIAPAASATIGVTSLALTGALHWADYASAWTTWWLGDLGGALIVAPFLILWFTNWRVRWRKESALEVAAVIGLLVIFGYLIFQNKEIFIYLTFPIFVWAVFSFEKREIATGVLILTEVSLWATLHGEGPFIFQSMGVLNDALILIDGAFASTAVTMLALAATIEENRSARLALEREKAADSAALANIDHALIVTNRPGEIVLVNSKAEELLGFPREELIGKDFFTAIVLQRENGIAVPRDERPLYQALWHGRRITNNSLSGSEYYMRKDGSRFPVSYTTSPAIVEDRIVGAIELFRDMSHEQEAELSSNDLIALASHQLRTPLSIIGLSSEMLQGQGKLFGNYDPHEVDSYAHDIQAATKQMVDIVNDLLSMSRIESQTLIVKMEPVDVAGIAHRIVDEMTAKIRSKQLKMSMRIGNGTGRFVTDRSLLTVILQNLISNAVKYAFEESVVEVSLAKEESYMVIVVSDVGKGIPHADQERVFEKFFRASNAVHSESDGTGLGLYITKAMVERLGGTISFVSQEGQGSTFIVRLPEYGNV